MLQLYSDGSNVGFLGDALCVRWWRSSCLSISTARKCITINEGNTISQIPILNFRYSTLKKNYMNLSIRFCWAGDYAENVFSLTLWVIPFVILCCSMLFDHISIHQAIYWVAFMRIQWVNSLGNNSNQRRHWTPKNCKNGFLDKNFNPWTDLNKRYRMLLRDMTAFQTQKC